MAEPQIDVPDKILELVERFENNQAEYRQPAYKETQLRREFLDPLFKALGWDVDNEQGYAEAYKDVVHEDAIKMGRATKAPDYSFRIGGVRRFFLEAKKPGANLREDGEAALQLRRYGWSAKLPLSLLSNFGELHVYDCRVKPVKGDKASHSRIKSFFFQEYPARWAELAAILSKNAVLKGAFDRYVEAKKIKKGTAEVDAAFLAEIERWRDLLARNLALRNAALSQRELNFAVQKTIDRIIFLRMGEDRGIEPYGRLQALLNGGQVYRRLFELFRQADDRYNSGLFHFQAEKERSDDLDGLTPTLRLDDTVLKDILKNLYYPDSPYEFSVLPADILGQVYEQFLGKVIRLTTGHQAKVEYKPEVRKAGGVYYTPTYIVDYIVRQTVGQLVEGKKISPRSPLTLRVLDPACGSGSFLLGAYQFLLDWHLEQYGKDPGKWAKGKQPRLYQAAKGIWKLTINERKRILLDHIFGVDLDPQAVEVTKLSLLLKVLEGEDQQSMGQLKLFHERALPDLGRNIKCGNSLIGPDFFRGQQTNLLGDDDLARINPFDWAAEFPEIMAGGGFEAVIGNPPYIRIQTLKEWAPREVELYKEHYAAAHKGNYDIYVVFVEKGLDLLNPQGRLGFILPHKFFNSQYGQPLREIISQKRSLAGVVHFGDQQVFTGATTYTCLLFLEKGGAAACRVSKVTDLAAWRSEGQAVAGEIPAAEIRAGEWNFTVGRGADVFEKLKRMPVKLGDVADRIFQGIRTSANEVYVLKVISANDNMITAYSKILNKNVMLESNSVSSFLFGREIKPYKILPSGNVIIIPHIFENGQTSVISEDFYRNKFPKTFSYLLENKKYLENREHGRMKGAEWYRYIYPKNVDIMKNRKILVPDIADCASFAIDETGEYAFTSGYGIIIKKDLSLEPVYILGLLNSNVLDFYLKRISTTLRGGFFRYFSQFLSQLPIRRIDFADLADAARHDRMVALVARMLELHQQQAGAAVPQDRERLRRQIEATDREIDDLVYELYGLTEAEIRLVEEKQG